ncbi:hypothetical protein UY3_13570 [Chelonia mydas]|uniref:Uncharacterized protein n=1 Tax=Chelonia mydas TaxID=8469 RepID=M7AV59_CHEMY|nr:hypothetical protein UY3_13570 [Chelonia mydas]
MAKEPKPGQRALYNTYSAAGVLRIRLRNMVCSPTPQTKSCVVKVGPAPGAVIGEGMSKQQKLVSPPSLGPGWLDSRNKILPLLPAAKLFCNRWRNNCADCWRGHVLLLRHSRPRVRPIVAPTVRGSPLQANGGYGKGGQHIPRPALLSTRQVNKPAQPTSVFP